MLSQAERRDAMKYFAGQALAGLLAHPGVNRSAVEANCDFAWKYSLEMATHFADVVEGTGEQTDRLG